MSTRAPGWLPDPGGRHEYRYWNGTSWTSDVATGGVSSVDPPEGHLPPPGAAPAAPDAPPAGGQPAAGATGGPDATAAHDAPTAAYGPPTALHDAPTIAQGPQTAAYPVPPGDGPPGGDPSIGQGLPAPAPRSGPPKGLLIGIGALAVAVIAGGAWALTRDDGDDTASDGISSVEPDNPGDGADEGAPGDLEDSLGDDELGDLEDELGDLDDLGESFGDLGTGGIGIGELDDLDLSDPEDVDEVVEQMVAAGVPEEMARCSIDTMVDVLGPERMGDLGGSGNPDAQLTPEESSELASAMMSCAFEHMDEMEGFGESFDG